MTTTRMVRDAMPDGTFRVNGAAMKRTLRALTRRRHGFTALARDRFNALILAIFAGNRHRGA